MIDSEGDPVINISDLQTALASADPSAVAVTGRTLRKVIKRDRGWSLLGGRASRQLAYVMKPGRLELFQDDLGIRPVDGVDAMKPRILIAVPDVADAAWETPAVVLRESWRRLFRARVEAEVDRLENTGRLESRIGRIGRVEFEEIRLVLNFDGALFEPADDAEVYRRFAGIYCDLGMFAPTLIRHAFPGLGERERIDNLIAEDVDPIELATRTRPEGAAEFDSLPSNTGDHATSSADELDSIDDDVEPTESSEPVRGRARLRILERADVSLRRGNAVRAAILRDASARNADPGSSTSQADSRAASNALEQLAIRLQAALFFRKGEIASWTEALRPLLKRASRGFWRPEARLLYDLQTVCIDHEKETYRIDLLPWIISLGRRPLKCPLPHLREVTMCRHLRSAARRLNQVRLSKENRDRLQMLLEPAVRQAETALRERFRSTIEAIFKEHWVAPANLPERVAHRKLIEELLDKIVEDGYTSLSDLRDAASRSALKLPDLASPSEFLRGTPLLKTDKALSTALEAVHRRGEIYLRWLQRFSALAFATPLGRFLSLYVALPFGGAFVVLEGLQHLVGAAVQYFTGTQIVLMNRWSLLTLGTFALLSINFLRFRHEFFGVARAGLRSARALLIDWPTWLLNTPWLRRVLQSRFAAKLWSIILKPALCTFVVPLVVGRLLADSRVALLSWGISTLSLSLLMNTKVGRMVEEFLLESAARVWQATVMDVLPGLFHLIMNAFQQALERLERLLYAVDEWLRFRDGQSQAALIAKGMIGLAWFGFSYLARIYVNLLIEPQINPIKHFPVVTVSHKVILPMTVPLVRVMSAPLKPLIGTVAANGVAALNVLLLPGVFGFLVWELKANWRLYKSNRSTTLDPVVVGSHGETMARLLRPGFHSGTVPKAYAKLRRAEAKMPTRGRERSALKPLRILHHVEEAIRRFVDRDAIGLLASCGNMFKPTILVGSIHLSVNRIQIELIRDQEPCKSLWLDIQELGGVLHGGIVEPGWLLDLDPSEQETLLDALLGLCAMSGVEQGVSNAGDTPRVKLEIIPIGWDDWVTTWDVHQGLTEAMVPAETEQREPINADESA